MNNYNQQDSTDDLEKWFDIDYSKTNIYQNWPAGDFTEHKLKYYPNIKYRKNLNDPPDFYLKLNNYIYNLEVKSIVMSEIRERNQFLLLIESEIKKYIDTIRLNMPKTKILAYIYPGNRYVELDLGSRMSVPDFSNKLSKTKCDHYIQNSINKYIKDFINGDIEELPIENDNGEVVVTLKTMTQQDDAEIFELSFFRNQCGLEMNYWRNHDVKVYLQSIINLAEEKYMDFNDNNFKWWLLMCDPENLMQLESQHEVIKNALFRFKLFEKVFLCIDSPPSLTVIKFINVN